MDFSLPPDFFEVTGKIVMGWSAAGPITRGVFV
jgi:hypothetical protein